MKYLKEAILKTSAKYMLVMSLVIDTIYSIINAAIVVWLSAAIGGDQEAAMKVVLGCVANTILDCITRLDISPAVIFQYMSDSMVNKVAHADYDMFVRFSPDSILATHSSIRNISQVVRMGNKVFSSGINIVVNIAAIFTLNKMAVLPIIPVFIIMALCMMIGVKKWVAIDTEFDNAKRRSNKATYDLINGYSEVRSFANTEDEHLKVAIEERAECTKILFKRAICDLLIGLNYQGGDSIATIVLMVLSTSAVATGSIGVAAAINTVMYGWRIAQPMSILIDAASSFAESIALIKPYVELMEFENTVPEGYINMRTMKHEIRLDNVSFRYEADSDDVLDDISLTIKKGEHIGICGSSGGGKSTLLRLIPKFYDRDKGSISIDGVDLRDISKQSLRSMIGIVHQDPYIFDGNLMDNIRYGNKNASYFEVMEACKKAAIYDFIMGLKDKFDTYVGPKGMKLSGGQKQRIALARIFLSDPDIIILDEATSALDTVTERFIQHTMETLFKDKTMIVVAHRLSTIVNSDRILVLDQGKIAEEGTHDDLLKKGQIYTKLIGQEDKIV